MREKKELLIVAKLRVYIGALQWSGNVVCRKQIRSFVVGKLGRHCKTVALAPRFMGVTEQSFNGIYVVQQL